MSEAAVVHLGRFSAGLSDDLARLETMVAAAKTEATRALRRANGRRIVLAQYALLVEWAGFMIIQQGLQHSTVRSYLDAVGIWLEWLNDREVEIVDASGLMLEEWHKSLYLESAQRTRTRTGKITAVRQFYEWLEGQGRCTSPMRSVKTPRKEKTAPRKYTDEQLRAMFASCNRETALGRRDYAILLLFYSTGARRIEIANLGLDQLSVQQRVARVKFHGKGKKERVVSFEGEGVKALAEWLIERDRCEVVDNDAVFISLASAYKGRQLGEDGLDDVVYRAAKKARLTLEEGMALHTLRVTFATDLYDQTKDIKLVQHILGHDSIETTEKYIAISDTVQKVRLSAQRIGVVTGSNSGEPPLWARHQLDIFDGKGDS